MADFRVRKAKFTDLQSEKAELTKLQPFKSKLEDFSKKYLIICKNSWILKLKKKPKKSSLLKKIYFGGNRGSYYNEFQLGLINHL